MKKQPLFNNILIIADIEGSSGCQNYRASSFLTKEWAHACIQMTKDVNKVTTALFAAGVRSITIKDFHRTGFNLISEMIDPRAKVIPGYKTGPIPGIGSPGQTEAVMFLGMHAASGTKGFLAHTLTSRIARLEVNGKPMAEVELFSASLAPYGLRPIFFSGCPIACLQAETAVAGLDTFPIDKPIIPNKVDTDSWRFALARAAVESLNNTFSIPYLPSGDFRAVIQMRDGIKTAEKIARRWGFKQDRDCLYLKTKDIHELYSNLIRLCYLTPLLEKTLPWGLHLFNLKGRLGLEFVRILERKRIQKLNKGSEVYNTSFL